MSTQSGISWTDSTWSPVTGCDPISPGCKHCYAKREVEQRWSKNPKSVFFGRAFSDVQCHESALIQPLRWKKGRKIFVCPRADLFHDDVPDHFLDKVFAIMAQAPQHTFQVLTKRPERMRKYLSWNFRGAAIAQLASGSIDVSIATSSVFALPNVWLGVTVENQEAANERIPLLLQTQAVIRWISAEPLLGEVDLSALPYPTVVKGNLHWVVVGGESGKHARPMSPDWARSLRDQCAAAGVPYFFKQWGEWLPMLGQCEGVPVKQKTVTSDGWVMGWAGTKAAGRLLDGVLHDAFPEVLR